MFPISRTHPKACFAAFLVSALAAAPAALAGQLSPPMGPVEATMKSLDQIEPRVCVSDLPGAPDAVHVISQPGRYYLTGDVLGQSGKHGLHVTTGGPVTIELNGFTLEGVPGSLNGIECAVSGIELSVFGFTPEEVRAPASRVANWGGSGISVSGALLVQCTGVRVSSSNLHGIVYSSCDRALVSGCDVSQCGQNGVHITSSDAAVIDVTVRDCFGNGIFAFQCPSVVCKAIQTKGTGITRVAQCGSNGMMFSSCGTVEVTDIEVSQCGQDGVHVVDADTCELAVSVTQCTGNGITASNVQGFVVNSHSRPGIDRRVSSCGGHGVSATDCDDVDISDLRVSLCDLDGVHVSNALECAISAEVTDCVGDGVEVVAARRLSACCIGSSGEDGVEVNLRVARCGGHGLHVRDCDDVDVSGVRVSDCTLDGVHYDASVAVVSPRCRFIDFETLRTANGISVTHSMPGTVHIERCSAPECFADGLHVDGALTVSVTDWRDNDCDDDGIEMIGSALAPTDVSLDDCTSLRSGHHDIAMNSIRNLKGRLILVSGAQGDGVNIECQSADLSQCSALNNTQCGMRLTVSGSLTMSDVESNDNGWEGILLLPALSSVQEKAKQTKCSARRNGFGIPGGGGAGIEIEGFASVELHEVDASHNAGSGIRLADFDRDGRLDLVTCSSNGLHGVHVSSNTGLPSGRFTATGVFSDGNGDTGMFLESTTGGSVSECVFSNNVGFGLFVIGSGHVVRSNTCTSNSGGPMFVAVPGNVVGPIVDELSVGGNCNPAANYVH